MKTYLCPRCGGSLYIEKENDNTMAVCCINGHRFEKAPASKYFVSQGGQSGHHGYKNQDNKSSSHQKGKTVYTLGRGIKERKV